jgi:hypothetical protein
MLADMSTRSTTTATDSHKSLSDLGVREGDIAGTFAMDCPVCSDGYFMGRVCRECFGLTEIHSPDLDDLLALIDLL